MRHSATMPVLALLVAAAPARAADRPLPLITCDEGTIELVPAKDNASPEVRGKLTAPDGSTWSFRGRAALLRAGRRTRTLALEQIENLDGTRPPRASSPRAPSQLFIDVILDDKVAALRHTSEGRGDPAVWLDLGNCRVPGDAELMRAAAATAPPDTARRGCDPKIITATWLPRVTRAASLADRDAREQATLLCAADDNMLVAHQQFEAQIDDLIARRRAASREGSPLKPAAQLQLQTDARTLADRCLSLRRAAGERSGPRGLATLFAEIEDARRCYSGLGAALAIGD